jgi:hypothetical protein
MASMNTFSEINLWTNATTYSTSIFSSLPNNNTYISESYATIYGSSEQNSSSKGINVSFSGINADPGWINYVDKDDSDGNGEIILIVIVILGFVFLVVAISLKPESNNSLHS